MRRTTAVPEMKTAWKKWPGFSGNTVGNIKISTPFTLSFQTKKMAVTSEEFPVNKQGISGEHIEELEKIQELDSLSGSCGISDP